ncbi:MAG: Deoxyhypusine synthase-like protein [Phycisphaerae bacterium]|nr:Deoxyhypusine synthase-like protein [Phycisphaerae bacterium]
MNTHHPHRPGHCPGKPAQPDGANRASDAAESGASAHDAYMSGRTIEPLALPGNESAADMIDHVYAGSGFNARRLADAAQTFRRMIEDNATIAITVSGAMTPIGMSGVFNALIERGFVDFFISTGANLYHDLHRPFDMPVVQGSPDVDDNDLNEKDVVRIYDIFIAGEDTLLATDRIIVDVASRFDTATPFSTARLHHALGREVLRLAPHPEKSFVAQAAKFDVPVYTSSPGDSSIGMNLIVPHLFGRPVNLNPILDVIETAAIVRDADHNGVIEIGGGSPKNFYMQTQPTLHQILYDTTKGGHDYFIQLSVDAPHWGGLSGATAAESKSWGKVKDAHKNNVVVYSCASITFPMIAQYVLTRCKPRQPRRLFTRIEEMVDVLRRNAKANETLKGVYPDLFR